MVWKGKTSLCCGGRGSVLEGALGAENRDVSYDWSRGGHRGSEVFATRGGDKDVVGVNGDIFMEWGEKEGVENFLSYLGGGRRHGRRRRVIETTRLIMLVDRVSFRALSGDCHRSLQSGLERTSPTLEPKSLLTGGTLSIVRGTGVFDVFHGSET
jgi:hypothetical protein